MHFPSRKILFVKYRLFNLYFTQGQYMGSFNENSLCFQSSYCTDINKQYNRIMRFVNEFYELTNYLNIETIARSPKLRCVSKLIHWKD